MLKLSDILNKTEIDITKVMMIRHSLNDTIFKQCYESGYLMEYTQTQKKAFAKDYGYWITFVSDKGTTAKLEGLYKVNGRKVANKKYMKKGFPHPTKYTNDYEYFDLERLDYLKDYEGRLIIDWGKSNQKWNQKATTDKDIVAIQANQNSRFKGYDQVLLTYEELCEIVNDPITYDNWHTALSLIYAIYVITDTTNGKQYVGSAYGRDGLLGRWSYYALSKHGNNKRMKQILAESPDRYNEFHFSILQVIPRTTPEDQIIELENLYKKKLMTKEFGMNDN